MSTYISKMPAWLLYYILNLVVLDFYFQIQILQRFFYVVYYKPNAYYVYLCSGKSLGVMPANINLFFSQCVHMGLSGGRECGS